MVIFTGDRIFKIGFNQNTNQPQYGELSFRIK